MADRRTALFRSATAALAALLAVSAAKARYVALTPYDWDSLPPRSSVVEVVNDFGRFRLPMGYLGNWWAVKKQPVAYDDGLRLFKAPLEVRFTMPGGGMNDNGEWDTDAYDPATGTVDAGHYVVWLLKMRQPDLARFVPTEVTALSLTPNKLLNIPQYDLEGHIIEKFHYYKGTIVVNPTHESVGFHLDCSNLNCGGEMYFQNNNWDFDVVFPSDRASDVFAVCAKASALLAAWTTDQTTMHGDGTKRGAAP